MDQGESSPIEQVDDDWGYPHDETETKTDVLLIFQLISQLCSWQATRPEEIWCISCQQLESQRLGECPSYFDLSWPTRRHALFSYVPLFGRHNQAYLRKLSVNFPLVVWGFPQIRVLQCTSVIIHFGVPPFQETPMQPPLVSCIPS